MNDKIMKKLTETEKYLAYKQFFSTFASEPRLRILNHLRRRKATVTQLQKELHMEQTQVSHNLARLKLCGFIHSNTEGKYRKYQLCKDTIRPMLAIIDKHMSKHCIHIVRNRGKQ